MKNFTKALLGMALLAGAAVPAVAADYTPPEAVVTASSFYIRGDGGWSWLNTDDNNDSALVLGGGVGYQINDNLRTDLRADWAGLGSDDDSSFTTVLGNVYFDIPTQTILTPYLGAGIGYGWSESNASDDDGVAFGLMAGVEVNLTENLSADVGYRYRQILSDDSIFANEALIGLRYSF
jgi:opacity protein-like surface antigen